MITGVGNKAPKQRKLSSVITAERREAVTLLITGLASFSPKPVD
jgi:hypothetical protein